MPILSLLPSDPVLALPCSACPLAGPDPQAGSPRLRVSRLPAGLSQQEALAGGGMRRMKLGCFSLCHGQCF